MEQFLLEMICPSRISVPCGQVASHLPAHILRPDRRVTPGRPGGGVVRLGPSAGCKRGLGQKCDEELDLHIEAPLLDTIYFASPRWRSIANCDREGAGISQIRRTPHRPWEAGSPLAKSHKIMCLTPRNYLGSTEPCR